MLSAEMANNVRTRVEFLVNTIRSEFHNCAVLGARRRGETTDLGFDVVIDPAKALWLHFSQGEEIYSVKFPVPFVKNGVILIQQNEVMRAVCNHWSETEQREIDYLEAMSRIILGNPAGLIPAEMIKKVYWIQRMINSFKFGNTATATYLFQKSINEFVNKMPLHETMMNSFVMNQRLIIVDPAFDELRSPDERLKYQTAKAVKYHNKGWTSIGLSDGTLADKNYILKQDLRQFSPFGIRFHNPQRNLYSTLGMKGDEYPRIRSASMQQLMNNGISRKGWNLFTAFVDVPDVFEDQIMVDKSLCEKRITFNRRFQIFGKISVKEGQALKQNSVLGVATDGEKTRFKVVCEKAEVVKVVKSHAEVGGNKTEVYNVVVRCSRFFKDGFKLTNLHGNKGIVRVADLGYAIDPRTGNKRKIDVIVSVKTIGKRRNYGQALEAVINCLLETDETEKVTVRDQVVLAGGIGHELRIVERPKAVKPVVFADDFEISNGELESRLEKAGYNRDGLWKCDTYAGKFKALCGTVFWGCIKTPEDQVWRHGRTEAVDGKGIRRAGLKISHVEMRALRTRFGEDDNPVIDEIMSYAQGAENTRELLRMAQSIRGVVLPEKPVLKFEDLRAVDQSSGTIVPKKEIAGTVVDEDFFPEGFNIELPFPYQILVDVKGEIIHEGHPLDRNKMSMEISSAIKEEYLATHLYVPSANLRKCWRHDTGKYGLSEVGVVINNMLLMETKLRKDPVADNLENNFRLYYSALFRYFSSVASMLGGKRGEISTFTMAVRYPISVKATAALSNTLPKNTVEIHRSMAKQLRVNNGDVVIAERFPCLGFMSVRLQKVAITDDPMAKFVIRVSGNSLVSQNLDFDGDVIYLMALHTKEAKQALEKEFANPNRTCYDEIKRLNERKGKPHIMTMSLQDINISKFKDMDEEEHALIVEKNTGVKAQTGPVIALTYNLMRIVENSGIAGDQKMKVAIEMFLEKAAQSVFEQKHGGKSLYDIVIEGVCQADVEMLVEVGFKRGTTEKLLSIIRDQAAAMGIFDLRKEYWKAKKNGQSNIISKIVRNFNRIYYASRAKLHVIDVLKALDLPASDIPSEMFKWSMAGRIGQGPTMLDKIINEERAKKIEDSGLREICIMMSNFIDSVCVAKSDDGIGKAEVAKEVAVSA
jgi:hypothetical protein